MKSIVRRDTEESYTEYLKRLAEAARLEATDEAALRRMDRRRKKKDGRRLAVTIQGQEVQLWLYDLSRETLTRFAFDGKFNTNPVWTPDGKRIAFNSNKEGPVNLFWQLADGSGGLERLTTSEHLHFPMSWSPNGQVLAFVEVTPTTGYDIWMLGLGDRKAQPFLRTPFNESVPMFSHDGRWLTSLCLE
jgi:Tol biopolymer transport system component